MSALTDRVAALPWMTRLDTTQDCDGYRWSHMPLKAVGDRWLMEKYKCRARARWRFTALLDVTGTGGGYDLDARDGTYCWAHLWTQLRHNPAEGDRTRRGLRKIREQETRT
jgi:hypothetical protein